MADETASLAAFGALYGVSKQAVAKWKARGYLLLIDGKILVKASIDALASYGIHLPGAASTAPSTASMMVDTSSVSQPAAGIDEVAGTGTIQEFLTRLLNGTYASQAEAERVKENALAGVRALELQRKAGALVEMEVAERVMFEVFRASRDSWLNWPSRIGPLMAADLGLPSDKVVEALTRHVHEHLADLGEPQADFGGEG